MSAEREPSDGRWPHEESRSSPGVCHVCHEDWPCRVDALTKERDALRTDLARREPISHAEFSRFVQEAQEQRELADRRGHALEEIGRSVGMAEARAEKDLSEIVKTVVFMGERYGPISQIAISQRERADSLEAAQDAVLMACGLAREYLRAILDADSSVLRSAIRTFLAKPSSHTGAALLEAADAMAARTVQVVDMRGPLRGGGRTIDVECQVCHHMWTGNSKEPPRIEHDAECPVVRYRALRGTGG